MDRDRLHTILQRLQEGGLTPEEGLTLIERETFQDIGFAKLDHQRARRKGFPEVVFAQGKRGEQLVEICRAHLEVHPRLLVTRLSEDQSALLNAELSGGHHNPVARTLSFGLEQARELGRIAVLCAGTSDLPVAEEALETARLMDNRVDLIADVGVAGIHRLFSYRERIEAARVVIVVAGMEGALPSVVGGIVAAPVIAVPTSVGYGASFGGIAALLAMLNSCAPGVTVVNIDNGFGAGFAASQINQTPPLE